MRYSLTMAIACGALLLACTGGKDVGGTATDTENMMTASVTGLVKRSDGTRADSVVVRMSRVYSKNESIGIPEFVEVRTDTAGVFAFDSAIADTFQLAVIDENAEEISYLPRVAAASTKGLENIKLEKAAVFSSVLYYDRESEPAVPHEVAARRPRALLRPRRQRLDAAQQRARHVLRHDPHVGPPSRRVAGARCGAPYLDGLGEAENTFRLYLLVI